MHGSGQLSKFPCKNVNDCRNKRGNNDSSLHVMESSFERSVSGVNNNETKLIIYESVREEEEDYLPLCDSLFNLICLLAYFSNLVFDLLASYTLYIDSFTTPSLLSFILIGISIISTQLLSLHLLRPRYSKSTHFPLLTIAHLLLLGIIWRYFKLFIPIKRKFVKSEVRDLVLLRLSTALLQNAPLLLLHLHLSLSQPSFSAIRPLYLVSMGLSLFNLAWALASFNKNLESSSINHLVLTWLGVIFQFLWRICTLTSRLLALALYSSLYHYSLFLVLFLHWLSMLLWLLSGAKSRKKQKLHHTLFISLLHIFCFINLGRGRTRSRVFIFYLTMFLENSLLVTVYCIGREFRLNWSSEVVIPTIFIAFPLGLLFMGLYYKYFHLNKLNRLMAACTTGSSASSSVEVKKESEVTNVTSGVFNCRFNPGVKRKKKKPSSFIPPPPPEEEGGGDIGRNKIVFWKQKEIDEQNRANHKNRWVNTSSGELVLSPQFLLNSQNNRRRREEEEDFSEFEHHHSRRNNYFIPSVNSSDADVDSCEDEDSDDYDDSISRNRGRKVFHLNKQISKRFNQHKNEPQTPL